MRPKAVFHQDESYFVFFTANHRSPTMEYYRHQLCTLMHVINFIESILLLCKVNNISLFAEKVTLAVNIISVAVVVALSVCFTLLPFP
jgi:hypothetical protein